MHWRAKGVGIAGMLALLLGGGRAAAQEAQPPADGQSAQGAGQGGGDEVAGAGTTQSQGATVTAELDPETRREARALFELAHAHYDAGRYDEAAAGFGRAYELTRRAELLYNLHLAYRDAGNVSGAVDALRRYLAEADPATVTDAVRRTLERRLAAMETSLGASRQDASPAGTDDAASGGAEDDGAGGAVGETRGSGAASGDDAGPGAGGGDGGLSPVVGGVLLGFGGATLAVAGIMGAVALGTLGERDEACSLGPSGDLCPAGYDQQAVVDRFTLNRDIAWGLFGAGLGVAAIGAVLLGVALGQEQPAPASVACTTTGCAVVARGSF